MSILFQASCREKSQPEIVDDSRCLNNMELLKVKNDLLHMKKFANI